MGSSVWVIARLRAKEGQEEALKVVLSAVVVPTRRELGCFQYDLLQDPTDHREFCFVERWESERSLDQHVASEHVQKMMAAAMPLLDASPGGHRYVLV